MQVVQSPVSSGSCLHTPVTGSWEVCSCGQGIPTALHGSEGQAVWAARASVSLLCGSLTPPCTVVSWPGSLQEPSGRGGQETWLRLPGQKKKKNLKCNPKRRYIWTDSLERNLDLESKVEVFHWYSVLCSNLEQNWLIDCQYWNGVRKDQFLLLTDNLKNS